ncbi:MAG TPA: ParA family partition ATPase [Acetobacteraceae bacterium]|nr:ParA family partition ATPase [Acetobacteraceae bacterium]
MALIITVAQQKGGAGKTMLAANLAAAWAPTRRVTLLDIDPQRSLKRWHALRMAHGKGVAIGFSDVSGWRLAGELDRLQGEADIILVDTPPHIDTDATRAIRAANLVLVPVQPSPPDLWAAEGTLALAAAERRRVALLLNRAAAKSRLRTAIENEIAGRRLTLLAPALGNRAAYALAFSQGMGVAETAARTQAGQEFAALAQAVLETAQ